MGLLSNLFPTSRPDKGAAADTDPADDVNRARARARQRLIGAVVLVGIGVIGFPLLFETQPRPIPVDVPIEIPRKDQLPPLTLPSARAPAAPADAAATRPAAPAEPITETAAEAGLQPAKPAAPVADETAAARPQAKPVAEPGPAPKAEPRPPPPAEADRARAILEGRGQKPAAAAPAAAKPSERYIVQIGAFADPALARATRLKVERLGMTTYTHVAKTPDGERTRVRVGPVATREDADKLAERLKAAGLPAAILTL